MLEGAGAALASRRLKGSQTSHPGKGAREGRTAGEPSGQRRPAWHEVRGTATTGSTHGKPAVTAALPKPAQLGPPSRRTSYRRGGLPWRLCSLPRLRRKASLTAMWCAGLHRNGVNRCRAAACGMPATYRAGGGAGRRMGGGFETRARNAGVPLVGHGLKAPCRAPCGAGMGAAGAEPAKGAPAAAAAAIPYMVPAPAAPAWQAGPRLGALRQWRGRLPLEPPQLPGLPGAALALGRPGRKMAPVPPPLQTVLMRMHLSGRGLLAPMLAPLQRCCCDRGCACRRKLLVLRCCLHQPTSCPVCMAAVAARAEGRCRRAGSGGVGLPGGRRWGGGGVTPPLTASGPRRSTRLCSLELGGPEGQRKTPHAPARRRNSGQLAGAFAGGRGGLNR